MKAGLTVLVPGWKRVRDWQEPRRILAVVAATPRGLCNRHTSYGVYRLLYLECERAGQIQWLCRCNLFARNGSEQQPWMDCPSDCQRAAGPLTASFHRVAAGH